MASCGQTQHRGYLCSTRHVPIHILLSSLDHHVVRRVRVVVICCVVGADFCVDLERLRQRRRPRCSAKQSPRAQFLVAVPRHHQPNPRRHNNSHLHRHLGSPKVVHNSNRRRLANLRRVVPSKQPGRRYLDSQWVPLSSNSQRRRQSLVSLRAVRSSQARQFSDRVPLSSNNRHRRRSLANLRAVRSSSNHNNQPHRFSVRVPLSSSSQRRRQFLASLRAAPNSRPRPYLDSLLGRVPPSSNNQRRRLQFLDSLRAAHSSSSHLPLRLASLRLGLNNSLQRRFLVNPRLQLSNSSNLHRQRPRPPLVNLQLARSSNLPRHCSVNPQLALSSSNSPRDHCLVNLLLGHNSSSPLLPSSVNPPRAVPSKRPARPSLGSRRVPLSNSKSPPRPCLVNHPLGRNRQRPCSDNPRLERNSNSPRHCSDNLLAELNNPKARPCSAARRSQLGRNRRPRPCLDNPRLERSSSLPLLCSVSPQGRHSSPRARSERPCLAARPSLVLLQRKRRVFSALPLRPNLQVPVCLGARMRPRTLLVTVPLVLCLVRKDSHRK